MQRRSIAISAVFCVVYGFGSRQELTKVAIFQRKPVQGWRKTSMFGMPPGNARAFDPELMWEPATSGVRLVTSRLSMSSRTRLILSFALFATTALLILTGPGPAAVLRYFAGKGPRLGTQMGHRELVFSLISDGLAWFTCLTICILIGRLAYRLRDRAPFSLTTYILGVFLVCFGLLRAMGYATLWSPLSGRGRCCFRMPGR